MSRGRRAMHERLLAASALALSMPVITLSTGCTKNFTNANDTLRREVLDQGKRIGELEAELARRKAQVHTLEAALRTAGAPPVAAPAASAGDPGGGTGDATPPPSGPDIPRYSGLEYDSYSGVDDADRDGVDGVVRMYVEPIDQQGRMLPIAGTARVQLLKLGDGEPEVLATERLDGAAWDAQYRDGFTGPYYLVELSLGDADPATTPGLAVRLEVTESWSGATHGVTMALD